MCGIAGVLGNPDTLMLHRMNCIQQHRGPDENDVWADEHVGFAHARLSIVDLKFSQQPMIDPDGCVVVMWRNLQPPKPPGVSSELSISNNRTPKRCCQFTARPNKMRHLRSLHKSMQPGSRIWTECMRWRSGTQTFAS